MQTPVRLSRLVLIASAFLGVQSTAPLSAQELTEPSSPHSRPESQAPFRASPYLPMGHRVYPILEYWIASGRIDRLSPFTKPYRRADVARAIAEMDEAGMSRGEREWLERLRTEFAPELSRARRPRDGEDAAWLSLELGAGAEYVSQTHRDPLRPELEGRFAEDRVLEDLRLEFDGAAGPVAGAFRGMRHGIYLKDPQFPDGRVVPKLENIFLNELGSRVEEAYLELQTRYASVSFGRMYRNWGAPGLPGFLRSDYAYTEEELGYRFGTARVFLVGTIASYSDYGADTTHYVAMHRLEIRPVDDLMIAVTEASVHGGKGQNLDFALVNPVSIWQISRQDDDPPFNKLGQIDLWWRTGVGVNVYGSFLADATNRKGSCCQIGGSAGFELARIAPGLLVRGNFSAVQSLTYRGRRDPPLPWEQFSLNGLGLGWDKTDLYLFGLEVQWFPRAGLWVRPRLEYQVKGKGDLRQIRPLPERLATFPRILIGDAETTLRPSLGGAWRSPGRYPVEVEWDLGVNVIRDYRNVTGDNRNEFVGSLAVRLRSPRWVFGAE